MLKIAIFGAIAAILTLLARGWDGTKIHRRRQIPLTRSNPLIPHTQHLHPNPHIPFRPHQTA